MCPISFPQQDTVIRNSFRQLNHRKVHTLYCWVLKRCNVWVRLVEEGDKVGFPLLVKAVLGGGGKGMKLATSAKELPVSTPVFTKSAAKVDMHFAEENRKTEHRSGISNEAEH